MQFFSETLHLPDKTFLLLRDLIHEYLGIYFDEKKKNLLADKLSPMVIERGFPSFIDFYFLLKYDAHEEDWRQVIDLLSVQETYFWREVDQVQALVTNIVPQWAAANPGQTLRIWSAACATGEEPLSMAIVLNEAGWLDRVPIEIMGTDASRRALQKARQGCYRACSFRVLPPPLQEKYFTSADGQWQIDPAVHSRVRWQEANLVKPEDVHPLAAATVIF